MEQLAPETVAAAVAGDRQAVARVLEVASPFVRNMLGRLVGHHDVDDMQQEALIKIATSIHRFRGDSKLKSWVGSICVFVARDYLRARKRHGAVVPVDEAFAIVDSAAVPEQVVESRQMLVLCQRALTSLNAHQQLAFVLKVILGHSVEEVAQLMRAAKTTTRLRLYYGRKAFAKAMAEQMAQADDAELALATPAEAE